MALAVDVGPIPSRVWKEQNRAEIQELPTKVPQGISRVPDADAAHFTLLDGKGVEMMREHATSKSGDGG